MFVMPRGVASFQAGGVEGRAHALRGGAGSAVAAAVAPGYFRGRRRIVPYEKRHARLRLVATR